MMRRFSNSMSAMQRIAVALAVAGVSPVLAQDASGAARRAAARMEEQAQASMQLLAQARQQYTDGKYKEALDSYRKSLSGLPQAPSMEKRRQFLEVSIADASVAVAQGYIKVGRYDEARELLQSALKTVPAHALAKRTLSKMEDPVRTNPAMTPQHAKNVKDVNTLLHMAYGYYELGDFDKAQSEFENILKIDPYNVASRRGLETVNRDKRAYADAARDEMRGAALAEVAGGWARTVPRIDAPEEPEFFSLPQENPIVNVDQKLGLIILPKVQLDGVTMEEAVEYLRNQARVHDTTAQNMAEQGVNIAVNTGQPGSNIAKEIAAKKITLNLKNIPLKDALQYVARSSGMMLRTNAFGAELITSSDDDTYMVSKTISVPPGFFAGLSDSAGTESPDVFAEGGDSGGMSLKRVDPQKALASMGIKFPEGSFVKYQAGKSALFFHGTPRDLSMLEDLVAARSAEQPLQVIITATFLEVNQTDLEELGFNWMMNLNLDPNKWFIGGSGSNKDGYNDTVLGSAATVAGSIAPAGVVGGLRSGNQVFSEDSIDNMLERGSSAKLAHDVQYVPGGAPSIMTMRGIWSQADITMVMRGLSQKKGADISQRPSVVVRPGEQTTFFCGQEFIYPTEYEPPQVPNTVGNDNNDDWGGNNNNNGNNGGNMPITPAHPTNFETKQLGTIFNVEVSGISEDKSIVEMTINPTITEFDGFINYGSPVMVPMVSTQNNKDEITMLKISDNLILQPVFSTRNLMAPVRVATGHTLVVGALKKSTLVNYEDKIPILGDIPWMGRLFRSKGTKEQRKVIIIMVKAEIVDPGGKSLYTPAAAQNMKEGQASLPALDAVH